MFSDGDIALKVRGNQRLADVVLKGRFQVIQTACHYLQQDAGEEISQQMMRFQLRLLSSTLG